MRLVIQRCLEASVTIDGECVSSIGRGLLVLVGVEQGDTELTSTGWSERRPG